MPRDGGAASESPSARRLRPRTALAIHCGAVLVLLIGVGRYYDSRDGFTSLIGFGEKQAASIVPALGQIPHRVPSGSGGYDGQFYVQMALDPLLRDPATDRALDDAPLRARRILLAWTAYVLGLGHPAWIVQAFALQNVFAWLALSVVLRRWFDLTTARGVSLWLATLFSVGMMMSVRLSLLDGPSLLLLAVAVAAAESNWHWIAAAAVGVGGLARETNVLGALACVDPRAWSNRRAVLRQIGLLILALAPLAIWFDYIHSIYRSLIFTSGETLARPFAGILWRAQTVARDATSGSAGHALRSATLVIAFATQLITVAARPRRDTAWWRIGIAYAALLLFLGRPLWEGMPPAVVRIELPLLAAFNVLLLRVEDDRWFWLLFVCGNLAAIQAPLVGMP